MTTPPRKKGGQARKRRDVSPLRALDASEAACVLFELLAAHPELVEEAERMATAALSGASFDAVADAVEEAVTGLGLDELEGRAGRHSWGYVGPEEAAWEICQERIRPFADDLKRRRTLGLEAEAIEIGKGILLGLYRAERAGGELLEYAPDFIDQAAGDVAATWKRSVFPAEFIEEHLPEWEWLRSRRVAGGPQRATRKSARMRR